LGDDVKCLSIKVPSLFVAGGPLLFGETEVHLIGDRGRPSVSILHAPLSPLRILVSNLGDFKLLARFIIHLEILHKFRPVPRELIAPPRSGTQPPIPDENLSLDLSAKRVLEGNLKPVLLHSSRLFRRDRYRSLYDKQDNQNSPSRSHR